MIENKNAIAFKDKKRKQAIRYARYYQKNKAKIYQRQSEYNKLQYKNRRWTLLCSGCGKNRIFKTRKGYSDAVKNNAVCNDCKKPDTYIDITGETFNKWAVIRRAIHTKDGKSGWLCRCECGTEKVLASYDLKNGLTRGCKCTGRKRPFEWLFNKILKSSILNNRACELTYEQFLTFTSETHCHYCGCEIKWIIHSTRGERAAYFLDRKNNNLGYSNFNCVVCCTECNIIKSNRFTYEEMKKLGVVLQEIREIRRVTYA